MNQGGTADSVVLYIFVRDSSLTDSCILSGAFLFIIPCLRIKFTGIFPYCEEANDMLLTKRWRRMATQK